MGTRPIRAHRADLDYPGARLRLLVWALKRVPWRTLWLCGLVDAAVVLGWLLLALTLSAAAEAATYYLSPTGSDSASGTASNAPWKTFGKALPTLRAGDTLVLLDGTYTNETTGLPYMNCSTGKASPSAGGMSSRTSSGGASAPITLKAEHERKAHLQGYGKNVLQLDNCQYWTIEGLYVSNVDVQMSGYEGSTIVTNGGSNHVIRRNLVYGPNAWFNSHGIALYNTHFSLVEENEVYFFTRHGIIMGDSNNPNDGTVIRRNYVHSRGHDSMPGGYTCPGSCENHRGDEGISCYPCKNSIVENNIVEDVGGSYTIQGKYQPFGNKYFGNVSLSGGGFSGGARSERVQNSPDQMPTNTVYTDNVAYKNDSWASFNCRTCKNSQYTNNTALDNIAPTTASPNGVNWDRSCSTSCGEGGDGNLSNYATNMLLVNQPAAAFVVQNGPQWGVDYLWMHQVGEASPPMSDPHYTHVTMRDPQLGGCIVYLPPGSPARGAGANGADIGANIINRYQDGVLT